MKIEIPHRFRLALMVAESLHYDWAWNHFISTRNKNRAFGHEILSLNESRDLDLTKFTVRFAMHGVVIEMWMRDHKNSVTYPDGRKMEDWRVYYAEVRYDNDNVRRLHDLSVPATIVKRYRKEELLKIKNSQYGWYHCEVFGEFQHIGEPVVK